MRGSDTPNQQDTRTRPGGPEGPGKPGRARRWWPVALKAGLGVGLTAALLAWALPRAVGASWSEIGSTVAAVRPWQLGVLAALWLLGLAVHTLALSAALPGLSHRRSFLLNITGSFVSNLLPLGGAAGTVANYSMARRWGFGRVEFARWALVTNVWDTLVKLALPAVAVGWLAAAAHGSDTLRAVALVSALGLALTAALVVALFRSDRLARGLGRTAGRAARRLRRPVEPSDWGAGAVEMRRDTAGLVATGWFRLTVGKLAYAAMQAVLLWTCLEVVGLSVHPAIVFAAYAVQNVLTLLVLTPGAAGFVEVGMAGVLVAMGAPAAGAAAAILLYRGFVFLMEIPVGGALLASWLAVSRTDRRAR
ncbi:lysylphosphatidylglycerol synthase domain-containing protein [Luteipulveratus flavus]|uniref:Lysylphosphatidylglycerol synthase domain-containing protein n=1 Tax=Luteipulveratus flavus TaxID=3031728 RepID=A0ABT6CAW7_9MICO|nr:lysylphosphatidylglycerol synthase domain-containing protein [Luteipulveratus sp. YIM 133296]MDF8266044.1 lysylphosphatidylglycerol synthase domain-containing protein [Luteipulveratus sp. YIM 133296]